MMTSCSIDLDDILDFMDGAAATESTTVASTTLADTEKETNTEESVSSVEDTAQAEVNIETSDAITESTVYTDTKAAEETYTEKTTTIESKTEKETHTEKTTTIKSKTAKETHTEKTTTAVSETEKNSIKKKGSYTTPEDVAEYIHTFGTLPQNFITKSEAKALGWVSSKGNLWDVAPGKSIGGDYFGNYEGLLPSEKGRKYTECDVNYDGGYRGSERIIFSNDGLIFYTDDHYESFTQLY